MNKSHAPILNAEGSPIQCVFCGNELGERFWEITQWIKVYPHYDCKVCGREYQLYRTALTDRIVIDKRCPCKLETSVENLNGIYEKWEQKTYYYCEECFKSTNPNIVFQELGE